MWQQVSAVLSLYVCGNMLQNDRIWKQATWAHVDGIICCSQNSWDCFQPFMKIPTKPHTNVRIDICLFFPGHLGPESFTSGSLVSTLCKLSMLHGSVDGVRKDISAVSQLSSAGSSWYHPPLCPENQSNHSLGGEWSWILVGFLVGKPATAAMAYLQRSNL